MVLHDTRIRLHGIDAPELGQMYGEASKKALERLINRHGIVCEPRDTDRYGRLIAVCYTKTAGSDIGRAMVWMGFAWAYEAYSDDYVTDQYMARQSVAGLWVHSDPTPPWEWRRGRRQ